VYPAAQSLLDLHAFERCLATLLQRRKSPAAKPLVKLVRRGGVAREDRQHAGTAQPLDRSPLKELRGGDVLPQVIQQPHRSLLFGERPEQLINILVKRKIRGNFRAEPAKFFKFHCHW